MRALVVGCGSIGSRHVRNLVALGAEAYVRDAEHRCAEGGRLVIGSVAYAVRGMDAVLICTPADTHAAVARDLLEAGYRGPLFVEKPIVTRLDDADVFREWPHPVQMVGYNLRFQPIARRMHDAIAPVNYIKCRVDCDMAAWPGMAGLGDPLLECSHEIDLARWCGAGSTVRRAERTDSGTSIYLDKGLVTINAHEPTYHREWSGFDKEHGFQWRFDSPGELGDEMYVAEMKHFVDAATTGGFHYGATFADGLAVVEIVEQARRLCRH